MTAEIWQKRLGSFEKQSKAAGEIEKRRKRLVGINKLRSCMAIAGALGGSACVSEAALHNGETMYIGSVPFRIQAPERDQGFGGIKLRGNGVLRFEIDSGMQWLNDTSRGNGAERTEISAQRKVIYGEATMASFRMRILSGAPTPSRVIVVAQLHGPNRSALPPGKAFGRPVVSLIASTEGLSFNSRSGSLELGEGDLVKIATIPLEFGRWDSYKIQTRLGDRSSGYVKIWKNDRLIARYDGAVGYDVGAGKHYWKFGVYRYGGIGEPSVVEFDRIELDQLGSRISRMR